MGWGSGAELLEVLLERVSHFVQKDERKAFYKEVIDCFANMDCDTFNDVSLRNKSNNKTYQEALDELFPPEED
jgi:hypothetical protein